MADTRTASELSSAPRNDAAVPASFIDLQVNGYGGVDFNQDSLTADSLNCACHRLWVDGVDGILATIITEDADVMVNRLSRLHRLRESDPLAREIIRGFHIEGPFISAQPGYVGAHPLDAVRPADTDVMSRLLDAGGGLVRLVTLAPECDPGQQTIRMLVDRGITVSAGHTDASMEQLIAAIDAGLSMFTHLGNGCPATLPRHDNIIQRVITLRDRLIICFIADGVHIPYFVLKSYLDILGTRNTIVVSDAMPAAGLGPGRYTLGRWDLHVGEDLAVRSPDGSHLIGSAMSMRQAQRNLCDCVGLDVSEAARLLVENPSSILS